MPNLDLRRYLVSQEPSKVLFVKELLGFIRENRDSTFFIYFPTQIPHGRSPRDGDEMQVPDSLARCIRVLVHWNTNRKADEILHVYLREAKSLRPDRKSLPEISLEEIEAAVKHFDLQQLKFDPDGDQ